jgi:hypothetical protein
MGAVQGTKKQVLDCTSDYASEEHKSHYQLHYSLCEGVDHTRETKQNKIK